MGSASHEAAVAIDATAEELPFKDNSFDTAMATFTVHQWQDLGAGLTQIRRVTTGGVVILTCDPQLLDRFWVNHYAPEVIAIKARPYPQVDVILTGLGGGSVRPLSISLNCNDSLGEAYYG